MAGLLVGATGSVWAQSGKEIQRLEKQFDALVAASRLKEAVPVGERLVQATEAKAGKDHPATGGYVNDLANLLRQLGRLAEAEPLYRRSNAITEKFRGPGHPDVAKGYNNLATLLDDQGRHQEAHILLRQALEIFEKALGPAHPDLIITIDNLASNAKVRGQFRESEALYQRSIAIAQSGKKTDTTHFADTLYNFANTLSEQDRQVEAEQLLKRSLALRERMLVPTHPHIAANLLALSNVYADQERYQEAEGLLKRMLEINEKTLGADHPEFARGLNNLAILYRLQDRPKEAAPLLERSLAIRERGLGGDHPDVAATLHNLGNVYKDLGQQADAERAYMRALRIQEKGLGADHPSYGSALESLGNLYRDQRRYTEATTLMQRVLANREKALGPTHVAVALAHRNIGRIELDQKHWAAALARLRGATAIYANRILDAERQDRAAGNVRYAFVELTTTAWGLAGEQPRQRDALAAEAYEAAQYAQTQTSGAALTLMAARAGAADPTLAARVRERQDAAIAAVRAEKALIGLLSQPAAQREQTQIAESRRTAEAADTKLRALTADIARAFPAYADLASPRPLPLTQAQRLLGPDELLVTYLVTASDGTYIWAATREGVQWQRIGMDWAALSSKIAKLRAGLDADDLAKAAAEGKLFDLGLAHELHEALLAPVVELSKGKKHLIVVPAGPLTSLPFHLLVTDKPAMPAPGERNLGAYRAAAWLIRRQTVTVLPSVASLRALRIVAKHSAATKTLVGFGNPVFQAQPAGRVPKSVVDAGASSTPKRSFSKGYASAWQGGIADIAVLRAGLAALPETETELRGVAQALRADANDLHLGGDASEATVKRLDLSLYRILYFATHGLIAGEIKGLGEPALALTLPVAANANDDGLLTASEVAQLKLDTDGVVLSACNTAAGDVPGADALSGLARAFFYAGARALLVSHWRVDSNAAVRLTTETFSALSKDQGIGRAEALRRAMVAYIDDTSSPWNAYPDYWAPFSLVGEGGAR